MWHIIAAITGPVACGLGGYALCEGDITLGWVLYGGGTALIMLIVE